MVRNVPEGKMSDFPECQCEKLATKSTFHRPFWLVSILRNVARPVLMLAGGTGMHRLCPCYKFLEEKGAEQPVTFSIWRNQ